MKPSDGPLRWHRLVGEQKRHRLTACGRRVLKIDRHETMSDTPEARERCSQCDRSTA